MGLFKRSARDDETAAPFVRGDGETSFTVAAGNTAWAYKRVLKAHGWQKPGAGGRTERLDVVLRLVASGTAVAVKHEGYPLGLVAEEDRAHVRRTSVAGGDDSWSDAACLDHLVDRSHVDAESLGYLARGH